MRSGAETVVMTVLTDPELRVIDASPEAQALLAREGALLVSFGRLAARRALDGVRLAEAARIAMADGTATVTAGSEAGQVGISLARLRQGDGVYCLVAILTVAAEAPQRNVSGAARRFGLTGAETRLLSVLFEGCSLPQAADRLGVARSTARTHLQRLFDKTGARRQAELVRTIALAA